ncbi:MAG: TIGR00730 family Rossman fold protein [Bdellovibrionota bacterium]
MKKIAVYLSAVTENKHYVSITQSLGELIVQSGYGLVFGGSGVGLMKVLADTVLDQGGYVSGVSVKVLQDSAMQNLSELTIAQDLHERKTLMREKADAYIALPGGNGTLDEITQVIEERKLGIHDKPVVVINADGFYDGLHMQYKTMQSQGFLSGQVDDLVIFVTTPEQAINIISKSLIE